MKFSEARKILADYNAAKKEIEGMASAAGVIAQNHFVTSFRNQGFTDEVIVPWKKRKRNERKGRGRQFKYMQHAGDDDSEGRRFKVKVVEVRSVKGGRAILVKSGLLRRSIIVRNQGLFRAVISSNLPYAAVHNDGLRSGRGKGFIMPKRQFIGNSSALNRKIITKFQSRIDKIFR